MQANAPETFPQPTLDAVDHGLVRGPQSWWHSDQTGESGGTDAAADAVRRAERHGLVKPDPHH